MAESVDKYEMALYQTGQENAWQAFIRADDDWSVCRYYPDNTEPRRARRCYCKMPLTIWRMHNPDMSITRLRCIRCTSEFDYDHPKVCEICQNVISPKVCIRCHNKAHNNHPRPLVYRYRKVAYAGINVIALFTYVSLAVGFVRLAI